MLMRPASLLTLASLLGSARATATSVSADAHVTEVFVNTHLLGSCTPYAWQDYVINVTESMIGLNLLFEVEDMDTAFNRAVDARRTRQRVKRLARALRALTRTALLSLARAGRASRSACGRGRCRRTGTRSTGRRAPPARSGRSA